MEMVFLDAEMKPIAPVSLSGRGSLQVGSADFAAAVENVAVQVIQQRIPELGWSGDSAVAREVREYCLRPMRAGRRLEADAAYWLRSTPRRALPDSRLEELSQVAASTGDDPALDALLLRLHIETACRRGGALALTPEDLDPEQCLIRLHEKGETLRWQPVSPTLMSHLLAHAESRGGLDSGQRLLRYANGNPITSRRYDYLWQRLGRHLPWVATQQVSMHWIRHTTLTWVERNFGFAVAQAYAGHEDHGRGGRAMATYVRADLPEVATALAALTGEAHPLAINARPASSGGVPPDSAESL
jgi:integrase